MFAFVKVCKSIELRAKLTTLFNILHSFVKNANIKWKVCAGICTDGVNTMYGRKFVALVKHPSASGCIV